MRRQEFTCPLVGSFSMYNMINSILSRTIIKTSDNFVAGSQMSADPEPGLTPGDQVTEASPGSWPSLTLRMTDLSDPNCSAAEEILKRKKTQLWDLCITVKENQEEGELDLIQKQSFRFKLIRANY